MPSVPFSKTGTAPEDTEWDWKASTQNAILNHKGEDDPDWGLYRQAHAWDDGSTGKDAEKKSAYKLPHHRWGENGLEAVWHGVSNAMARLEQSDIPEDDMKPVFDHLSKHYAQWDKTPPEWDRWIQGVRERRAKGVTQRGVSAANLLPMVTTRAPISLTRDGGVPTSEDLQRINTLALKSLSADDVYIVPMEISSDAIDAYYTKMTPLTLNNFAQDASGGVAFCDSHEHRRLPIGRFFYGQVAQVQRDGGTALTTQAMAYIVRAMALSSGINSDELIRGIDAGIYADVSVGFIPIAFWCSICGCNMLAGWDCIHWPGQTYEVKDQGDVQCIALVDARLGEASLVYDGATPNAMVLKAQHEIEAGRANVRLLTFVEDRCRVKLFDRYSGFGPGLMVPANVAHAAPGAATTTATTTSEEDDDMMKGTTFIRGIMERAGKEISQPNLDRLQAIHDKLSAGHDTMDEAMREMGDFMAEKSSSRADDAETDPDGQNKQPKEQAGAKGAGDDTGDDQHGEEEDTAQKPGKDRAAKKPVTRAKSNKDDKKSAEVSKPGTDDGDGDDDNPTYGDEKTEKSADDPESDDDLPDPDENDPEDPENYEREDGGETDDDDGAESGAADPDAKSDGESGGKGKSSHKKRTAGEVATDRAQAIARLSPVDRRMIEIGRQAYEQLLEETMRAGARVFGQNFDEAVHRSLLANADYDQLLSVYKQWQGAARTMYSSIGTFQADRTVPGGGRWTEEPTGQGGRQTAARDANDPAGMAAAASSVVKGATRGGARKGVGPGGSAYTSARTRGVDSDASLFTVGPTMRSTRAGKTAKTSKS